MKLFTALFLVLLPAFLWGSKILSYNIYDRNDRVDVMLTFDTPYEGVLRQNRQNDTITIKLEGASLESQKVKNVNSRYLKNITLTPQGEQIEITALISSDVVMQASKTSDSYGLRLRFMNGVANADNTIKNPPVDEAAVEGLPTKNDNEFEQSYYVVIAVLIIGIAILFWLKQNIAKRSGTLATEPKVPWLFNKPSNGAKAPSTAPVAPSGEIAGGVHIRFQKTLDPSHTIAMLDYGTQSYLVLLGNNTLLLDKFQDNIPVTQNDFETLLQSKHRELDGFFQLAPAQDEPFNSYKAKASGNY
ncbi:MAG: hypothetical protein M0P91_05675 [Sulfuricurvum sp.]|jgi:hypothetical protein|uniref:hypothetical protein n=1 Tax=Sulfuricurvum sp. TaxID=2025608 RepID=UPI0025DCAC70|nr:hypothetical protein [Sulfuricurvum sp.]MCK9372667.1 hypothetical protein [Sulfuricurvum sp.]